MAYMSEEGGQHSRRDGQAYGGRVHPDGSDSSRSLGPPNPPSPWVVGMLLVVGYLLFQGCMMSSGACREWNGVDDPAANQQ